MTLLFVLLALECLSSAVLLFQIETQVVMHSILGGLYLLSCMATIIMAFSRVHYPIVTAVIATMALLTLFLMLSEEYYGYIILSSFLILFTSCMVALIQTTHVRHEQIKFGSGARASSDDQRSYS